MVSFFIIRADHNYAYKSSGSSSEVAPVPELCLLDSGKCEDFGLFFVCRTAELLGRHAVKILKEAVKGTKAAEAACVGYLLWRVFRGGAKKQAAGVVQADAGQVFGEGKPRPLQDCLAEIFFIGEQLVGE